MLVINPEVLSSNIERMQRRARDNDVRLRPHVKTHKCVEIARRQLALGAVGLTASRPAEALVFLREGLGPITIAYPIVDPSSLTEVIAASTAAGYTLRVIVDSVYGLEAVASAAATTPLEVMLKVDVGLHRCGVELDDARLVELPRLVEDHPRLTFVGLISHAGHAYGAASRAEVAAIAESERVQMIEARERIEDAGIAVTEVSVGSTPTVVAATTFAGITEIRPGNYVFLDRTQIGLGVAAMEEIALTVRATVISSNSQYFIIDAGSKTLSSDRGAHGVTGIEGFGLVSQVEAPESEPLVIERLSEEHGFVRRGTAVLPIGSRVVVYPNHACVVANLGSGYEVDGDFWRVRRG